MLIEHLNLQPKIAQIKYLTYISLQITPLDGNTQ